MKNEHQSLRCSETAVRDLVLVSNDLQDVKHEALTKQHPSPSFNLERRVYLLAIISHVRSEISAMFLDLSLLLLLRSLIRKILLPFLLLLDRLLLSLILASLLPHGICAAWVFLYKFSATLSVDEETVFILVALFGAMSAGVIGLLLSEEIGFMVGSAIVPEKKSVFMSEH